MVTFSAFDCLAGRRIANSELGTIPMQVDQRNSKATSNALSIE